MEPRAEDERREAALYQALRREVNERQRELATGEQVEFTCECSNPDCDDFVSLTRDEYEYIRRVPNRLVVRIGHVDSTSERVIIEEPGRFQVLEKFG